MIWSRIYKKGGKQTQFNLWQECLQQKKGISAGVSNYMWEINCMLMKVMLAVATNKFPRCIMAHAGGKVISYVCKHQSKCSWLDSSLQKGTHASLYFGFSSFRTWHPSSLCPSASSQQKTPECWGSYLGRCCGPSVEVEHISMTKTQLHVWT